MKHLILIALLAISFSASQAQENWKPNPNYIKQKIYFKQKIVKSDSTTVKIQCSGTKPDGARCKRKGYPNPLSEGHTRIFLCWQHANQE